MSASPKSSQNEGERLSSVAARRVRPSRFLFALPAVIALLIALWAGLSRIGWDIPSFDDWDARHGPLMISGFLGVLISMERAVGSGWRWAYIGPALAGAGVLALLLLDPLDPARLLFVASSLSLVALFALVLRDVRLLPLAALLLAALLWLAGNLLWLRGDPLVEVIPWWTGFLVVTILGERLELAGYTTRRRSARVLFLAALALLVVGIVLTRLDQETGQRLAGIGMIALAAWLFRFDVARRTIRRGEPARYIAASLLAGYVWLAVGGIIWLVGPQLGAVFVYDATVHVILLGFVFSMIFGHALIILPAVLRLRIDFQPRFYAHLAFLHASVALRLWGDLEPDFYIRRWAGLLNALAILLFLASTLAAIRIRQATPAAAPALDDQAV